MKSSVHFMELEITILFKKVIQYPSTFFETIRFTWNFAVVTWGFLLSWEDKLTITSANLRTGLLLPLGMFQRDRNTSKLRQFSTKVRQVYSLQLVWKEWIKKPATKPIIPLYLSLFFSLELMRQNKHDFVLTGR